MKIAELKATVKIPEGVQVSLVDNTMTAKGKFGEAKRTFNDPKVTIKVEGDAVLLSSKNASKRQKRSLFTAESHIKNIVKGVKDNNEYKLKICASHFPMQVALEGNIFIVKNFFGEKVPRRIDLPKEAQVKIQGDKITVTGADVQIVGEACSKIEQVCYVANRDRRVFQDGIFLIEKNGNPI